MKWRTYWWGIEFLVESHDDVELLERLNLALPGRAEGKYEDGDKEEVRGDNGKLTLLRFHR